MSNSPEQEQNRRHLLAAVLRYATLGLLGTVGASIISKRRRLVREGKCINDGICRGCEVLETCGLPLALSAKEF
ncbi:MAG: hypothetical protein ACYSUY_13530 [Planctomycetota bacterium]|jgi:hypothetical protein